MEKVSFKGNWDPTLKATRVVSLLLVGSGGIINTNSGDVAIRKKNLIRGNGSDIIKSFTKDNFIDNNTFYI